MTLLTTATLACGGCLERKERLKVQPDGCVQMTLTYLGSADDFKTQDTLPSEASGWKVARTVEKEGKDEKHVLTAERLFAAGEPLPASYAAPGDPNAELSLRFPTELRIEQRPDGTYYHFKRTYEPRPWAYVQYWHERFMNDEIKKIGQKPKEQLTQEDRVKILWAFGQVSLHEQLAFAAQAVRELTYPHSQDSLLAAEQAMRDVYQAVDYDSLAYVVAAEQDATTRNAPAHDAATQDTDPQETFAQEADATLARAVDAYARVLQTKFHWGEKMVADFRISYDRARKYKAISDQLGTHAFEIAVEMPGEIVAHNANEVDATGAALWRFNGDAVRDRAHELMVTSRVKRAADGKTSK